MQVYFKKDYLNILYDDSINVLVNIWIIPPFSEEFREGMNALVMAIQHFKTGKVIFDTTELGVVLPGEQQWITGYWYKKSIEAGYSHVAFVKSANVFTQMTVEDATNKTENRIPTAYFDNMEAAIGWIKQF